MNNLRNDFREIRGFYSRNSSLTHLIYLIALCAVSATMPKSWIELIAMAALMGTTGVGLVHAFVRKYERKINDPDPDNIWDVQVNSVSVGKLNETEYATLKRDIALDPSVYVAQLGNLGHALIRATTNLVTMLPAAAFWCVLAWLVCDAESLREVITSFANATPQQMQTTGLQLMQMLILASVLSMGVALMMGFSSSSQLGLENKFDGELYSRALRYLKCPANGYVVIYRCYQGPETRSD